MKNTKYKGTPVKAGTRKSRQGTTMVKGKAAKKSSGITGQAGKAAKAMKKSSSRAKDI